MESCMGYHIIRYFPPDPLGGGRRVAARGRGPAGEGKKFHGVGPDFGLTSGAPIGVFSCHLRNAATECDTSRNPGTKGLSCVAE